MRKAIILTALLLLTSAAGCDEVKSWLSDVDNYRNRMKTVLDNWPENARGSGYDRARAIFDDVAKVYDAVKARPGGKPTLKEIADIVLLLEKWIPYQGGPPTRGETLRAGDDLQKLIEKGRELAGKGREP